MRLVHETPLLVWFSHAVRHALESRERDNHVPVRLHSFASRRGPSVLPGLEDVERTTLRQPSATRTDWVSASERDAGTPARSNTRYREYASPFAFFSPAHTPSRRRAFVLLLSTNDGARRSAFSLLAYRASNHARVFLVHIPKRNAPNPDRDS